MNEDGFLMSLADSWLGQGVKVLLVLVVGAFAGWWTSRAKIMNAVTNQVNSLMEHQQRELKRLTDAEIACTIRLERLVKRVEQLEGELRQEKQVAASIKIVGQT